MTIMTAPPTAAEVRAEVLEAIGLRGMVGEVCWDNPPYDSVSVGDTAACLARLPAGGRVVRAPVVHHTTVYLSFVILYREYTGDA